MRRQPFPGAAALSLIAASPPEFTSPRDANGAGLLHERVAARRFLAPGVHNHGLFENGEAFVRGDLSFGLTPGGSINGKHFATPYFNWGCNHFASSILNDSELAYLFTLFASTPETSTGSVREPDGYLEPSRGTHHDDTTIRGTCSEELLNAHEASMRDAIPDLHRKGQVEYFDELTLNIRAADAGKKTPKQALRDTARASDTPTERMGPRSQRVRRAFLKSSCPTIARRALR